MTNKPESLSGDPAAQEQQLQLQHLEQLEKEMRGHIALAEPQQEQQLRLKKEQLKREIAALKESFNTPVTKPSGSMIYTVQSGANTVPDLSFLRTTFTTLFGKRGP
jgi:hypothetical protein